MIAVYILTGLVLGVALSVAMLALGELWERWHRKRQRARIFGNGRRYLDALTDRRNAA